MNGLEHNPFFVKLDIKKYFKTKTWHIILILSFIPKSVHKVPDYPNNFENEIASTDSLKINLTNLSK